jgi:uncharacterized membrane protein
MVIDCELERNMDYPQLTKIFLRLFIFSVVAMALVGIVAISGVTQEWVERKVLLTTLIIAVASVCGLACGGCLTRGHRILPSAGLALTSVAAAMLLAGIWMEFRSESYWKTTATASFFAVACAHLSMLFMANLAGRYRWAYFVAYPLILGLATLMWVGFGLGLFEKQGYENYWRLCGVVAILVAAITLIIPVFHRFSREEVAAKKASADPLFAVDEEIARLKKQLVRLESERHVLLGRTVES